MKKTVILVLCCTASYATTYSLAAEKIPLQAALEHPLSSALNEKSANVAHSAAPTILPDTDSSVINSKAKNVDAANGDESAAKPSENLVQDASKIQGESQSQNQAQSPVSEQSKNQNEIALIQIETRSEIMGLWGMQIPNQQSCVEYYNFRNANEVAINSGKEWSYAQYDYQPSVDPSQALAALVMQVKFDNNQVDCSGHQQDQTGEVAQYFVRWKDRNHIQFCATEKGDKCVANLYRVLP